MSRRAQTLPETRGHVFSDWELRESLRRHGVLQPVLQYRGELIDGFRRVALCRRLQLAAPPVHDVGDTIEAARILWHSHPRRAYERFAELLCGRKPRHSQLVYAFGCSPGEIFVADVVRGKTRRRKQASARLPGVECDATLLRQAHARCRERGIFLSGALRGVVEYLAREYRAGDDQECGK